MSVDAVIFDIGNVLIEWQPERYYDARIGEARRRAMFATVDLHGMNDRVDRGEDFRATIYETAEAYPEFAEEIRLWHDDWLRIAAPRIEGSIALLQALQARGIPVFALTNFGIGSFEVARVEYPFLETFDRAFVSGHLGLIKPDPAIYEVVEREGGVAPERLLFTDDRAENIAAAAERGWQVHLFEGPAGWGQKLVEAGLLDPADLAA